MTEPEEDRFGLTPEQWEWHQKRGDGFGDQDENGVDLSLLRENLKLTPTQRIERNRRAMISLSKMKPKKIER